MRAEVERSNRLMLQRWCVLGACVAMTIAGCEPEPAEQAFPSTVGRAQIVVSPDASITGIIRNVTGQHGGVPFTAVLTISRFVAEGGAVYGLAQLSQLGGLTPTASQALAAQPLKLPVSLVAAPGDGGVPTLQDGGAACPVLALVIKPLALDVLGVRVDLAGVDLGAKAVSGGGNLLGNVLCGIFRQLDPSGLLKGLDPTLSDRVVGFLNGLTGGIIEGIVDAINGEGQDLPGVSRALVLTGIDAGSR